MTFFVRLMALLLCGAALLGPLPTKAQDLSRIITLDQLAVDDPVSALQQTEAALRDSAVLGSPPELRILIDLLTLRAQLLEQLGYAMAAGDAWSHVARTQKFSRAELNIDPVPAYEQAAALYESQNALGHARRALEAAISAEAETGRDDDTLEQLYLALARVATLDGDPEAAANANAAAQSLSQPSFETALTEGKNPFISMDVYYATDRARSGHPAPTKFYSGRRGDRLELGIATVTIPATHVPGTVERPSVWRLEFSPSPSKHVLLRAVQPVDPDSFYGRLQGEFSGQPGRDLFVYIHGFNHSFEYASQRAAQIAHDMGDSAVPVLFSWPSRNTTVGYIADAAAVRVSGRRLAVFLEDLAARSGAQTIHVLAHSMGSRALTDALEIMALKRDSQPGDDPVFGQVMFAAPDVDAQLFATMARTFHPLARRVSLYASSTDWALVSSRKLHGSAPRAGLGGDVLLASDKFDSIDVTSLGEDMLAHNYFSNESSVLADMVTLFWRNTPPDVRCGLHPRAIGQVSAWEYRKQGCPSNDLIGAIANLRQKNARTPEEMRALITPLIPDQPRLDAVMALIEAMQTN
ncbi:alpha/beta hydrolase [Tropicibacter naphthalenivorans]|uniref:Esterase of the alpha/beta hydrolase fold protein n=1 Tax=Tropicibacter naphthalenivorans TaxID=441103 RepID=A0A0P1GBC2_9RHOB|nr:alpha/beta hydrolase [Tropicibacter naphthalenivorans]CUH78738.1 hypothetical protein TRN7648_02138 [Tropicibacter naphthalenivorans]SMC81352.1 Esterase/lipase superfamily enzyme [Tropicibacter naphthalenivorans]